jgi:hypothetical protein
MVAMGLLRRLGAASPDVMAPYRIASGLDVAIKWARRLSPRSAWVRPTEGLRPSPGDIVQILGPMHVLTVIGWEEKPDGTLICVSVDGGQLGLDGLQMVSVCRRPWIECAGTRLGTRKVDGWIDVDLLPYTGPVILPEETPL